MSDVNQKNRNAQAQDAPTAPVPEHLQSGYETDLVDVANYIKYIRRQTITDTYRNSRNRKVFVFGDVMPDQGKKWADDYECSEFSGWDRSKQGLLKMLKK